MRQNQYRNLMKIIQKSGSIGTNEGQRKYMGKYKEPIQIGTRLGDLTRSGYLLSIPGKHFNVWLMSDKGDKRDGEEIIITRPKKVKKTKEESEIKKQNKELNRNNEEGKWERGIEFRNEMNKKHTLREHIKSLFGV